MIASASRAPVRLVIEKNSRLSKQRINTTIEAVANAIESSRIVAIPSLFPQIDVELVGKSCRGIQIVDFLMWANNRRHFSRPDRIWNDRLEAMLKLEISSTEMGADCYQGSYIFKESVRTYGDGYPQGLFPLAEPEGLEEVRAAAKTILERTLPLLKSGFEEEPGYGGVRHLEASRARAKRELVKARLAITIGSMRSIASLFMRMFDMLPIYSEFDLSSQSSMTDLLKAKRLASVLVQQTMQSVQLIDFIAEHFSLGSRT